MFAEIRELEAIAAFLTKEGQEIRLGAGVLFDHFEKPLGHEAFALVLERRRDGTSLRLEELAPRTIADAGKNEAPRAVRVRLQDLEAAIAAQENVQPHDMDLAIGGFAFVGEVSRERRRRGERVPHPFVVPRSQDDSLDTSVVCAGHSPQGVSQCAANQLRRAEEKGLVLGIKESGLGAPSEVDAILGRSQFHDGAVEVSTQARPVGRALGRGG